MLQVINEDPVSEEHVAWFTTSFDGNKSNKIGLHEVVKAFYRHPDVPEYALISQLEERFHGEKQRVDHEAAAWVLLEATQQTVCNERGVVKIRGSQQIENAKAASAKENRTCETCQHWTRRESAGSGLGRCPKNAPPIEEYEDVPATGGFNTTSRLHSCENWLKTA